MVRVAEPVPDVGDTCSHGAFDEAVQLIVPAPVCVMRTVWASVTAVNPAPLLIAVKISELRSSIIVGPVTDPA